MTVTFPALASRSSGSGPTLVLLHAFPTDSRLFDGLVGRLPARLVTPDLPGFGASALPEPAPDVLAVSDLVDLLTAWLEGLGTGRAGAPVVLGGVAIGGYLAIELAAARPDLVAGLVLIGCKPAPDTASMAPAREAVARLALSSGAGAVAGKLVDQPLAPGASAEVRATLRGLIEACDPRGIAGLVRGLAQRPDPVPSLDAIAASGLPVLVVNGADDPFTPPAQARALAERVPGARYVEIPGCGHLPPLEAPDPCAAAIAGWLVEVAA